MLSLLLALATMLAQPGEPSETALEGQWRNPSGSVIISITPRGESLCGRVQGASDKAMADARKGAFACRIVSGRQIRKTTGFDQLNNIASQLTNEPS